MKQKHQAETAIDSHLQDIQHGSDFARAMELVWYGVAVLVAVIGGVDLFTDYSERDWWSIGQNGVWFFFVGFGLGYLRKVTLTIVKSVEELRTTV
ncbi:MAG: hypothetical protein GY811_09145 [Myxococcales bacterium]|nr:hypothetical protein [Myxococcales bacterium]